MIKYSLKRFVQSIFTIIIIVSAVFLLMRLMPKEGYFSEDMHKLSPEIIEAKLTSIGYYKHPLEQLKDFAVNLMHGSLGVSYKIQTNIPVTKIISDKAPVSMYFGLAATVISLILGVILGMIQASYKGKFADAVGTAYIVFVNAVPPLVYYFFIWVYLSKFFGLPLRYSKGNPQSFILPLLSMVVTGIAGYALWIRRYMVDELNKDYIKLARAKGLPYKRIMYRHVLRNAFVPMVQYIPVSFLMTVGGSLLVEQMYAIPGMGDLLITSINKQDNNLVQALILIYATIGIVGIFIGDLLMILVDPRITIDSKGGSR